MHPKASVRLDSKRLFLRPLVLDDAPAFIPLLSGDRETVMRTGALPWPVTENAVRHWIAARIEGHDRHVFAVFLNPNEVFIGVAGFGGPQRGAELGYWFGRAFWGRGLASEAVRLLLEYARRSGYLMIRAHTFPDNPASARVLAKAGFRNLGLVTDDFPERGGRRNVFRHQVHL